MRLDVVTIFPEMFAAVASSGITARARERGLWSLQCWNPRDFAENAYRSVDDRPYGGGPGMVMTAPPLAAAIEAIRRAQREALGAAAPVVHLSPRGVPLTHERVVELSRRPALTLLASRYEAVDQRLLDRYVDEELAVGDFVVSGGELPAMMLIDAVVRLQPGALNDARSALEESFATGVLDCPHYTRPEHFGDAAVPEVLLSGNHARIERWRREQALAETARRRPDLLARARQAGRLGEEDERFLAGLTARADDARIG